MHHHARRKTTKETYFGCLTDHKKKFSLQHNSQVEEKTHPQIETQAQKDAHEIEVIFFSYYYITYQRVSF